METTEEVKFERLLSNEQCPARQILTVIGDKWSIIALILLDMRGTIRFNELSKHMEGISSKVLSQTLKALETDGLIYRTVYPEVPPRVEYALTTLSRSLLPHIHSLSDWAFEHMDEIYTNRRDNGGATD